MKRKKTTNKRTKCKSTAFSCDSTENHLDVVAERDQLKAKLELLGPELDTYREKERERQRKREQRKNDTKAVRRAFGATTIVRLIKKQDGVEFDNVVADFIDRIERAVNWMPGDPGKHYPLAERVEKVIAALEAQRS